MSQIQSVQGNILVAEADAIINTVNCVGVMGKGLALQFKQAYPENFKAYAEACRKKQVQPGRIFVYKPDTDLFRPMLGRPRFILNFPTKEHWRNPSRLSYISHGLKDLIRVCRRYEIQSIAIPPLGCALGGLDWRVVRPMVVKAMAALPDVRVLMYDPPGFDPESAPAPVQRDRTKHQPPF